MEGSAATGPHPCASPPGSTPIAYDCFGYAVAVAGDTGVAGASGEASNATRVNGAQGNNSTGGAGAAYVFATAYPAPEISVMGTAGATQPITARRVVYLPTSDRLLIDGKACDGE